MFGTRYKTPQVKQSMYFGAALYAEIMRECQRLDRPLSWVVQRCVATGLKYPRTLPAADEVGMPVARTEQREAAE